MSFLMKFHFLLPKKQVLFLTNSGNADASVSTPKVTISSVLSKDTETLTHQSQQNPPIMTN